MKYIECPLIEANYLQENIKSNRLELTGQGRRAAKGYLIQIASNCRMGEACTCEYRDHADTKKIKIDSPD